MARRVARSRGRLRPRRKTDWIGGGSALELEFPVTAIPQAYSLIDLQDMDEHQDRMTVIRIRGQIAFARTVAATNEFAFIDWGVAIQTTNSVEQLINLNPAAFDDQDSEDWLWRGSSFLGPQHGTVVGALSCDMIDVDIKAQRKMEGEQLLLLWAALDAFTGGGNDVLLWRNLRVLVKLA